MLQSHRAWVRVVAWALAAVVLLGLGLYMRSGTLERNDQVASVVSMFGGLISLGIAAVALRLELRRGSSTMDEETRLNQAVERLAEAVHAQWDEEAKRRSLRRPAPVRLSWSSTTRPVSAAAQTIAGNTVAGRVTQVRLRGHIDEVADKFLALPHRRLVVLGQAGGGKTVLVLMLTLELLARRQPGQPVPLLLALSSWDPTAEHLHTWAARQLTDTYLFLRHPMYGSDAAERLISSQRVLLILDGLDELPKALWATTISELDRAADADWPLVVTCRSEEYEQAVTSGGGVLSAAAVVELHPVTATEATAFLSAATPSDSRWGHMFDHLHAHPRGELAIALSSPLMVSLARIIYTTPNHDPSELIQIAQSGGRRAVERRLLEGFIAAAYADPPVAPGAMTSQGSRSWNPARVRYWLTVLAVHLDRLGARDLAWWQLRYLLPQLRVRLLIGLVGGLVGALVGGLMFWLELGLIFGLKGGLVGRMLFGLEGELVGGLGLGLVLGLGTAFALALPTGLVVALWPGHRAHRPERVSLQIRGRLGALFSELGGWLSFTLGLGVGLSSLVDKDEGFSLPVGLAAGLAAGIAFGFAQWLRQPVDDARALTPRSSLRGDRALATIRGLGVGLGVALIIGLALGNVAKQDGLAFGLAIGLSIGLATGFAMGLTTALTSGAWGPYTIVRGWLAVRNQLPWALSAFLEDANRRGVLRQAGAVYQFRHILLQNYLVDTDPAPQANRDTANRRS